MEDKIVNIINEEPFVGEDGLDYIKVTKEILTPRKTYLKGIITGKYRGDKIPDDSDRTNFFDFQIYEAEVNCNSLDDFRKNEPFEYPKDFKNIAAKNKVVGTKFPKEKLPKTIPVLITANNKSFGINILEPELYDFKINRKYHQIDGDQIYGCFDAFVTGYVFDYEREEVEEVEQIYNKSIDEPIIIDPTQRKSCEPNGLKTGNVEEIDGYIRQEYYCKNHNDTVWSNWEYKKLGKNTNEKGCLSEIFGGLGLLLALIFLIVLLPNILYLLGFWLIAIIIGWLAPFLKWIFRVLWVILLFSFIVSLVNAFLHTSHTYTPYPHPSPNPIYTPPPTYIPIVDSVTNNNIDKWIVINRAWEDYDNNKYSGTYKIKQSDFIKSHNLKNNLPFYPSTSQTYDKMIYTFKENDKSKISSVYNLFDSIAKAKRMSKIKFAEMIVTFVQTLPYAVIVEQDCDASLYNDSFTRDYLSKGDANCDPFEKFGINTPLEFLTNQKGDCDTRTLLIYTLLSHYNYDVALLSSEYYGHSIIGINLPIKGNAYIYKDQRYVLWETTIVSEPGVFNNEMSNLNNWRISLKSL